MKKIILIIIVIFYIVVKTAPVYSQGASLHGIGAVNEGMAGTATGAAVDAAGALQWNSASISALKNSEISIGLGLGIPSMSVSSKLPDILGGYGGGTTDGEPGAVPLPSMALVKKTEGSRFTWGLLMGVVGGSRLNYKGCGLDETDPNFNPILTPQSSSYTGYGSLNADIQMLQVAPTLSFQVTEKLSVGLAPTISMANISCHPLYLVQSEELTSDVHNPQYYIDPSGTGTRWAWGAGFQIGVYYDTGCGWAFGASYKSRQWLEDFRYNIIHEPKDGTDPTYVETIKVDLDYPDIISFGFSYNGLERWLFACDFRYFLNNEVKGFPHLGWKNVFGFSFGIQHELTQRLTLRGGYSFNENPVPDECARDNVASPLIQQHGLYLGASFKMTHNLGLHVAYSHMFKSTVEGDYFGSNTQFPGGYVKSTVSCDTLMASFSVGF
ncbi:MAG: outer membrane protein transport protein [Planctomycetia bacterium]|nr:outer membrane protein transport protein [Planctomycetia bacterium]